ncbi:MAG: hypothetical protein ABR987_20410 [Terracidiphilus sp.]
MRRNLPAFVLLLAITGSAPATAKPKKPSAPEAFETAHTVFVEARDDHDITDIWLDPDDRKAILDVQDGIQDWGRYTLSRSRRDADLILVVYKGRVVRDQSNSGAPGSLRIRRKTQGPNLAQRAGTRPERPERPAPSKAGRRSRKGLSQRACKTTDRPITQTLCILHSTPPTPSITVEFPTAFALLLNHRLTGSNPENGVLSG